MSRALGSVPHAADPVQALGRWLQNEYSNALYGAQGRVAMESLRLLWLQALPPAALAHVGHDIGVCLRNATPPERPFYSPHGDTKGSNPRNSLWIHRRDPMLAVPPHSWIEVTHCTRPSKQRVLEMEKRLGRRVLMQAMWFFVAPGSGVTVNVGRTRVFRSHTDSVVVQRGNQNTTIAALDLALSDLKGFDSVQFVGNQQAKNSIEQQHELVLLAHADGQSVDLLALDGNTTPPVIMCGRHPHLLQCSQRSPGLQALKECANTEKVGFSSSLNVSLQPCNGRSKARLQPSSPTVVSSSRRSSSRSAVAGDSKSERLAAVRTSEWEAALRAIKMQQQSQLPPSALSIEMTSALTRGAAAAQQVVHELVTSNPRRMTRDGAVLGSYSCPIRIGNFMHNFLSAFAYAVATNRRLLWRPTPRTSEADMNMCQSLVQRRDWHKRVTREEEQHAVELRDALPGLKEHHDLQWQLDCANIHSSVVNQSALHVIRVSAKDKADGRFDGQGMAAVGLSGWRLRGEPHGERARRLFALGPHYAFGLLFRASFEFEHQSITSPTQRVLHAAGVETGKTVVIGVHMRHVNSSASGEEGLAVYVSAIQAAVRASRQTQKGRRCAILLASDRRNSAIALESHTRAMGCSLIVSEVDDGSVVPTGHDAVERGIDTGVTAIRDLCLLSHAETIIATWGSTFSLMAIELVAQRYTNGPIPMAVWCNPPSGSCAPPQPIVFLGGDMDSWWHVSFLRWPHVQLRTATSAEDNGVTTSMHTTASCRPLKDTIDTTQQL